MCHSIIFGDTVAAALPLNDHFCSKDGSNITGAIGLQPVGEHENLPEGGLQATCVLLQARDPTISGCFSFSRWSSFCSPSNFTVSMTLHWLSSAAGGAECGLEQLTSCRCFFQRRDVWSQRQLVHMIWRISIGKKLKLSCIVCCRQPTQYAVTNAVRQLLSRFMVPTDYSSQMSLSVIYGAIYGHQIQIDIKCSLRSLKGPTTSAV